MYRIFHLVFISQTFSDSSFLTVIVPSLLAMNSMDGADGIGFADGGIRTLAFALAWSTIGISTLLLEIEDGAGKYVF
jgi:hypothetical protein